MRAAKQAITMIVPNTIPIYSVDSLVAEVLVAELVVAAAKLLGEAVVEEELDTVDNKFVEASEVEALARDAVVESTEVAGGIVEREVVDRSTEVVGVADSESLEAFDVVGFDELVVEVSTTSLVTTTVVDTSTRPDVVGVAGVAEEEDMILVSEMSLVAVEGEVNTACCVAEATLISVIELTMALLDSGWVGATRVA